MNSSTGFTLIELMITLALVSLLMTLGIPSFNEAIRNNRLTTYTNDLVTA
ncbi:pilus assembly FimT family protein, partial [Thiolapillus sp.]